MILEIVRSLVARIVCSPNVFAFNDGFFLVVRFGLALQSKQQLKFQRAKFHSNISSTFFFPLPVRCCWLFCLLCVVIRHGTGEHNTHIYIYIYARLSAFRVCVRWVYVSCVYVIVNIEQISGGITFLYLAITCISVPDWQQDHWGNRFRARPK